MDTSQVLKGVLDTAVLATLSNGETYGYELVRRLRLAGFEDIGEASIYGTLRRLYGGGYLTSQIVASDEGPHRKYYGLNGSGRDLLERSSKTWTHITEVMDSLLNGHSMGEGAA